MSVADHFDHTPEAGFIRAYDSAAARRQFQVSVVLIVVLAAAAMVLGMVIRFDDPRAPAPLSPTTIRQAPVSVPAPSRGASGGQDFARRDLPAVLPALRG